MFVKTLTAVGLLLVLLFASSGCEQNNPQAAFIDFEFALLNSKQASSASFNEGENFVFSFRMINRSNEDVYLSQASFNTAEFLKVYLMDNAKVNASIPVGKPYKSLFCTYQNGILIPAHDTLRIEIPWMPPADGCCAHFCLVENNSPLPAGKYRTEFNSAFEFFSGDKSYQTDTKRFKIDFEVK